MDFDDDSGDVSNKVDETPDKVDSSSSMFEMTQSIEVSDYLSKTIGIQPKAAMGVLNDGEIVDLPSKTDTTILDLPTQTPAALERTKSIGIRPRPPKAGVTTTGEIVKLPLGSGGVVELPSESTGGIVELPSGTTGGIVEAPPKKKLNPEDYEFKNEKGRTLIKAPGSINGIDFAIDNLSNCDVYILDYTSQIMVDNCTNCRFFIGPVDGSFFIRDCRDCVVTVVCRQFRTRGAVDCIFRMFCYTQCPIIEMSHNLKFTWWNGAYPKLSEHMKRANMDPKNSNYWNEIYDFNENDDTYLLPHYEIVEDGPSELQEVESTDNNGQDIGLPENPIPMPDPVKKVMTEDDDSPEDSLEESVEDWLYAPVDKPMGTISNPETNKEGEGTAKESIAESFEKGDKEVRQEGAYTKPVDTLIVNKDTEIDDYLVESLEQESIGQSEERSEKYVREESKETADVKAIVDQVDETDTSDSAKAENDTIGEDKSENFGEDFDIDKVPAKLHEKVDMPVRRNSLKGYQKLKNGKDQQELQGQSRPVLGGEVEPSSLCDEVSSSESYTNENDSDGDQFSRKDYMQLRKFQQQATQMRSLEEDPESRIKPGKENSQNQKSPKLPLSPLPADKKEKIALMEQVTSMLFKDLFSSLAAPTSTTSTTSTTPTSPTSPTSRPPTTSTTPEPNKPQPTSKVATSSGSSAKEFTDIITDKYTAALVDESINVLVDIHARQKRPLHTGLPQIRKPQEGHIELVTTAPSSPLTISTAPDLPSTEPHLPVAISSLPFLPSLPMPKVLSKSLSQKPLGALSKIVDGGMDDFAFALQVSIIEKNSK